MSERRCEGCRWWRHDMEYHGKRHGVCRRLPPVGGEFPESSGDSICGEWQDATITPEQAERRELMKRFAEAIVRGMYTNTDASLNVMPQAQRFTDRFVEAIQEGQQ